MLETAPVKTLVDFLRNANNRRAKNATEGILSYFEELAKVCERHEEDLAVMRFEYTLGGEDGGSSSSSSSSSTAKSRPKIPRRNIRLFDVKPRSKFEDETMERIYAAWGAQTVCPLRRGICVGSIDENEGLIATVGNVKFFYADKGGIDEICDSARFSQILVSEKANGEMTMAGITKLDEDERWITVGSKNVRVTLPFDLANPLLTLEYFDDLIARLNAVSLTTSNSDVEEIQSLLHASSLISNNSTTGGTPSATRFSYVKDMIKLWLNGIVSAPHIARAMETSTLVGEQVGVHAHIFTNYGPRAHIRLFSMLPHSILATHASSSLLEVREKLSPWGNEETNAIRLVEFKSFQLPEQDKEAREELSRIARGSLEVFGEGSVVYCLGCGRSEEPNALTVRSLYKFKCEEYFLDRKLRTLLAPVASELWKLGMSRARLAFENKRIVSEIERSRRGAFENVDETRFRARVELIPAILAFLERHQTTLFCSDFSDNFTETLTLAARPGEGYDALARRRFTGVDVSDPLLDEWKALLGKFSTLDLESTWLVPLEERIRTVVEAWRACGGVAKGFRLLGVSASPGGGKTHLLSGCVEALSRAFPESTFKFFDRDAYVIAMGAAARGDVVHREWMNDMVRELNRAPNTVVLVGNTFSGAFADKLPGQLVEAGGPAGVKLMLVATREHTLPVNAKRLLPSPLPLPRGVAAPENDLRMRATAFDLVCLRRLARREEVFADGSTLTMNLGAKVVLEKFFASQPDENTLKTRLKCGTAAFLDCTRVPPSVSSSTRADLLTPEAREMTTTLVEVAKGLINLKNRVQNFDRDEKRAVQQEKKKLKEDQQAPREEEQGAGQGEAHREEGEEEESETEKPKLSRTPPARITMSRAIRPALARAMTSGAFRPNLVCIFPTRECALELHKMCGPARLWRTDAHATLCFAPTLEELDRIFFVVAPESQPSGALAEYLLDPSRKKAFELGGICTVAEYSTGEELRFAFPARSSSSSIPDLISTFPTLHVTLGYTSMERLPPALCGRIIQHALAGVAPFSNRESSSSSSMMTIHYKGDLGLAGEGGASKVYDLHLAIEFFEKPMVYEGDLMIVGTTRSPNA